MGSVTCERVKIDRMGYTSFGRYFGPVNTRDRHNLATAPVFLCADEDSGTSEYVRGFDAADAKRRFMQVLTRTSVQPSLWQRSSPTLVSLRRRYATWPHFVEVLDEYADIKIPDTVPVVYVPTAAIPIPPARHQSAIAMKREEAHAGKMVDALLRGDDMPPILLNADGTIHDGRARLLAALRTGLPAVPVVNIGPFRTGARQGNPAHATCSACDDETLSRSENPIALRHVGFCPVCTGVFKVRDNLLVHHGYKRPGHGYIVGDCYGVHRPPHELSSACAEGYLLDVIGPYEKMAANRVEELKAPERLLFPYRDTDDQWAYDPRLNRQMRKLLTLPELVALRRAESSSGVDYPADFHERVAGNEWASELRRARGEAAAHLEQWRRERVRIEGLVAGWVPKPLVSVEEQAAAGGATRAARNAARDEKNRALMQTALAKLQARVDSAVKNRNANAIRDLFEHGYKPYRELSLREGQRALSREEAISAIDRDHVWSAFGLLVNGRYVNRDDVDKTMIPWSTYNRSRLDLTYFAPGQTQLPPQDWPAALGGGKTKTPA